MALDKKLFKPVEAAADGGGDGTGNQEEGLVMYVDANDVDSYDGDGSIWYDISDHEYTPATDVSEHFNTVTYTGTASNLSITGVGFQPDLVWIKGRSYADHHMLYDSLRGALKSLSSSLTNVQSTNHTDTLKSFDSDGFTLGADATIRVNKNNATHVAWCFKAGGAPSGSDKVSIDGTSYSTMTAAGLTDGTEPISKLSVNTKLGFSIVKYTAPALRVDTVAHGLGETPEMIILKSTSVARNWNVFHKDVGTSKNLHLNLTDAANTSEDWTANSTTFSIQDYSSSADWIAYCFTSKRGVSKVGSYTGEGNPTKIYTGFQPAWIMIKNISRSGNSNTDWQIFDNKRSDEGEILIDRRLKANESTAEAELGYGSGTGYIRFERDGVTLQGNSFVDYNYSGDKYIYLAFAKNTKETSLIDDTDLELHLDPASYSGSGTTWTADTGNNGTLVGNTSYDEELGDFFDLDGSGDYISVSTSSYLDGDFTIEMWWNFDGISSSSGYKMLWGGQHYGSGGTGGLGHYILDNKIKTWVSNTSGTAVNIITSGAVLESGKWYHIVLTRSGSSMVAYVDGENVGSGTYSGELSSPNTKIGAHYNSTLYNVDGRVGQVRVYNSALTQDQIRQNFNFTKNDYPNGFNGTLVSGALPTFSTDHFDFVRGSITGGSDQVVFNSAFHSYLKSTSEGTITAWIKVDAVAGRCSIFATGHTSDNNDWAIFRTTTSRTLHFSINNGGTANGFFTTSTSEITTGSYIHVAMSVNSAGIGKMYINGVSQAVSYQTGSSSQWFSDVGTNTVTIGSFDRGSSGQFYDGFDGEISQVKFYNRVLTDTEISDQHTAGR